MPGPSLASPGVVAWRTRHLVGLVLALGLALVGLTLVASQTDPTVIDLGATRGLQQFQDPAFASLMSWVSWFGFAPQTWFLRLVVANPIWASTGNLGQHWLSDVLGGYAVASLLLVPYCWAYARWRLDVTRSRFTISTQSAANPL